ncbi:MAG TPA: GNAT family N-acetyltransferase, partial [Chloroflexia bacterium]|nr:GNAT family N-acetyltransferase [Chloroflexia bacterium]
MTITLRPIDLETDCFRMADLQNSVNVQQTTGEILREEEQKLPSDAVSRMIAAVNTVGDLVGYYDAWHLAWMPEGHFRVLIRVDPAWRGQGIGTGLYADALRFMLDQGATHLGGSVRDDQPDWLRFATRRGYRVERQEFTSLLDLSHFDETPFAGAVEAVTAQGIRFLTLAEAGNTPEAQRRLYELTRAMSLQSPGADGFPDFAEFSNQVFAGHW